MFISALFLCSFKMYAGTHTCPSLSAIKQKINDKNLVKFEYSKHGHFGGPDTLDSKGVINFFDSFDTNETWVFHFDVSHVWDRDKLWDLFQNYLSSQPDISRIAKDADDGYIDDSRLTEGRWVCRYTSGFADFGMGTYSYNVFAVAKAP